jgi:hypothetical protein
MIKIIDTFPPQPTKNYYEQNIMETDPEDVYFSIGCARLGLPLGDDEASSHFCIHYIYKDSFFGFHQLEYKLYNDIITNYPEIKTHPFFFIKN